LKTLPTTKQLFLGYQNEFGSVAGFSILVNLVTLLPEREQSWSSSLQDLEVSAY